MTTARNSEGRIDYTRIAPWNALIFGTYPQKDVLREVDDVEWQRLRVSLKGTSLEERFRVLKNYIMEDDSFSRRCRVTNYVYALKRGGMIR